MKKSSRIPSWVLPAAAVVFLVVAGALFWSDYRAKKIDSKDASNAAKNTSVQAAEDSRGGTLLLPDPNKAPTDSRRRSKIGLGDRSTSDTDKSDDTETLAALSGATIALMPASGIPPSGGTQRMTKIGAVRVPCAGAPARKVDEQLATQRALLDSLAEGLREAGVTVMRVDDSSGRIPCAGERVKVFEQADLALIVSTGDKQKQVLTARSGGAVPAAESRLAERFARSMRRELDIKADGALSPNEARQLLTRNGVINLPGGGVTLWLELGKTSLEKAENPAQVKQIKQAMADALSSTDADDKDAQPTGADHAKRAERTAPAKPEMRSPQTNPAPQKQPATQKPAPQKPVFNAPLPPLDDLDDPGQTGPGSDQ